MSYGSYSRAAPVFSTAAIGCAVAAFLGFSPLLAVVAILAATVASGRGEGPARVAVLLSIAALFAGFFLPSVSWWAGA
jgi:hypothetical protein